ncbi:MAG: hypothetical protein CMB25_04435 [Euryarchaeota archaeon]|nr:hypothetical protein [Euryarchaeota archaeon]|tara:strand:+ start:237 stop:692 length:456 start_codon:yes stop_codon:yes gene_type:complete
MVETMLLVAFLTASLWVGPFWMLMLLQPYAERTKKWMNGPWFVLGPLIAYLVVLAMNMGALNDMMADRTLQGIVSGLANVLGTEEGAVLAWTHFVIGDIIVTRWIWKRSVETEINKTLVQVAILFGVMLMPVGLAIHFLTMQMNKENNTHS